MKKLSIFLMLMALFAPLAMNADEKTVYDGTGKDYHVPLNSNYADYGTRSQFIIPASELTDLNGADISKLTFYSYNTNNKTFDEGFTVYLKEVNYTTFSYPYTLEDWSTMTSVWTGTLVIINNKLEISFTSPYTYGGGNLMIGFQVTTWGGEYIQQNQWTGVTQSSVTALFNDADSNHTWSNYIQATQFLPKTTFTYTSASGSGYNVNAGTMSHGSVLFNTGGDNWYDHLSNVDAGETVYISVQPETGYELAGTPTVTPTSGTAPTVSGSGNLYSFAMPESSVMVNATFNFTAPTIYAIGSQADWETFCALVNNGYDYSGETVTLTGDVTVGTENNPVSGSNYMAGTSDHKFKGTFDGDGHTLTFYYSATADNAAPFAYLDGATIQDLHVNGTITTSKKFAAGIAAHTYGTNSITNCQSSIVVRSSVSGDGTHGGFVGVEENGTLNISGCLFNGKLLKINNNTDHCGGFVGWRSSGTLNISDGLYMPAALGGGETWIGNNQSATFARNGATIINCYYTTSFDDGTNFTNQGKHGYTISGDTGVTVANAGTETTYGGNNVTHFVTGYGTGIKCNDVLYAGNQDNVSLTISGTLPEGHEYYASAGTLSSSGNSYTLTMPNSNVTISILPSTIDEIDSQADWEAFCAIVNSGNNYSGKTVTLTGDVTVGTENNPVSGSNYMAGTSDHKFSGTFNGGGHTLTFYYTATEQYAAPFRYIDGAAIQNLHVDGTIQTSAKYAAGIAAQEYGITHITNCRSSIVVKSSVSGDGTHSGLVAVNNNSTLTIEGCVFDGKLLTTNGTNNCGGFVGWRSGTLNITNSIYNPAEIATGETEVLAGSGQYMSKTFARTDANITNCFYTRILGSAQGKQPRSITAGEYVTNVAIALTGNPTNYNVSGITAYSNGGLDLNGTLYYGNGDNVSLTISGNPPEGYVYSASPGTLSGNSNPYTLNMPDADVTISANIPIDDWANLYAGSATDPYMIYNKDQLNLLAYRVNGTHGETLQSDGYVGKYFKLGADIEYTYSTAWNNVTSTEDNYEAIGSGYHNSNCYFKGDFDGNGHTISGIRIYKSGTDSGDQCQGIFGKTNMTTTIHDLILADARITASSDVGGIVGYNMGGTVSNCHATSTVTIHTIKNNTYNHGGIVGRNTVGTVTHCTSAVTLSVADAILWCQYYGGIAGFNTSDVVDMVGSLTDNFVIGAIIPAVDYYYQGAICGAYGVNANFERNYYYNCTVAGVQNATGVGCGNLETISDITDNDGAVYAVIRMVKGYGESTASDHWTFISSPLMDDNTSAMDVVNLINTTTPANYDLYKLVNTTWANYKTHDGNIASGFSLENGQGYLYANKNDVGLVFKGTYNTDNSKNVTLQQGWNLVGNPFDANATINSNYYKMNDEGTAIVATAVNGSTPIAPCTGVIVQATGTNPSVTFTKVTTQQSASSNQGSLQIALTQAVTTRGGSSTATLDNAIVSFNEGSQLGKFYFGTQKANLYLPQDAEEYAIAFNDGHGEMPVNFRANENGQYTITVTPEGVEMIYLHLIDNMTGADVDLLQTPEYTFNAKVTDYESRFRLVFSANDVNDNENDNFAFIGSHGQLIINGTGTIQIIDIMGRVISTRSTEEHINTNGMTSGVYILRLITGSETKTQKIVVK